LARDWVLTACQPEDDVAVALAGSALGPEPVDHVGRQPDVVLAALVDRVVVAHAAERQGRGDGVEGGLGDGDADLAAAPLSLLATPLASGVRSMMRVWGTTGLMLPRIRPPRAQLRAANQPNTVHPRSKLKTKIAASHRHLRRTVIMAGRK
jgi:hypothetical protein